MEPTDLAGTLLDVYDIENIPEFYLRNQGVRVTGNANDNWTVVGKVGGLFKVPLGHVEKHDDWYVPVHNQVLRTPQSLLLDAIPALLDGFTPRNP